MCGRFTLATPASQIAELFALPGVPALSPRFNIAPTQNVAIVRRCAEGSRELATVHWGLIPFWAKDRDIGARMINARSETVASKPAFRAALRSRRCLVPADGFYEWRREGARKQPYYFTFTDGRPFALAGLWERWESGSSGPVESCAIMTTSPNELVAEVHDRMPVIVDAARHELWLDTSVPFAESVTDLVRPYPAAELRSFAVGLRVNDPANDSQALRAPLCEPSP